MRKRIKIDIFCRDNEVYVMGDRVMDYLAETILEHPKVQQECNRPVERKKRG